MQQSGSASTRAQVSGERFEIDGVQFMSSLSAPSTSEVLSICKNPSHVDRYREILEPMDRPRIVELGIHRGGSVAMLSLVADPAKLVAIDLAPDRVAVLDDFLAARDLADRIRPHYGVDQADRERLGAILSDEMGDEPLDLVIDDASHLYGPTRTSFELLFPRLRDGGVYLIEDWSWHHIVAATILAAAEPGADPGAERPTPTDVPLSRMAVELMLAVALPSDKVSEVTVNDNWILVRRGAEPLDPTTFSLTDLYTDHFGLLDS